MKKRDEFIKRTNIDKLVDSIYGSTERIILDFIIVFLVLLILKILNII